MPENGLPLEEGGGCRAPSLSQLVIPLERQTQRELDQPRRPDRREDLPKRAAETVGVATRSSNGAGRNRFHVVDRWIREVRVVPDVEEVRREPQIESLREMEVFQQ